MLAIVDALVESRFFARHGEEVETTLRIVLVAALGLALADAPTDTELLVSAIIDPRWHTALAVCAQRQRDTAPLLRAIERLPLEVRVLSYSAITLLLAEETACTDAELLNRWFPALSALVVRDSRRLARHEAHDRLTGVERAFAVGRGVDRRHVPALGPEPCLPNSPPEALRAALIRRAGGGLSAPERRDPLPRPIRTCGHGPIDGGRAPRRSAVPGRRHPRPWRMGAVPVSRGSRARAARRTHPRGVRRVVADGRSTAPRPRARPTKPNRGGP
jgi:hypothetical protein